MEEIAVMNEAVGGTMRRDRLADRDGLATKSHMVAHIGILTIRFAVLEAEMEAFKTEISATANRVIVLQVAISVVLFAALKLF